MKKRQFTVILLIWLFSQQLFAAAWLTMPHPPINCTKHNENYSDCTRSPTKHMSHNMAMMHDIGDTDKSTKLSMSCDHCSTACQVTLISYKLLPLVTSDHLPFATQFLDAPVDIFLSTLYRPPIFA